MDAYYRYDPTAPRGMGPPGNAGGPYARHRAPHPMQQQQPQSQYPTYQPATADNMYSMPDHSSGMAGMGDALWGAQPPPPPQANPYGAPMGYGHPQGPQPTQRQTPASYRQHMTGYPQQDSSKLQYPTQQAMMGGMMPQQGYGSLSQPQQPTQQQQQQPQQPQQQQQQQRVSQHYPQAGHSMYPGAPVVQPQTATAQAGYASYAPTMHQQANRSSQHVYNQHQLDQTGYGQHMVGGNQVPTSLHQMSTAQQQQQQPPGHPPQQSHLPIPGQSPQTQQQQMHASQMQPVQQQQQQQQQPQQQPTHGSQPTHPQAHPQQHPGLAGLSQQQSQQQSGLLASQHPGMPHSQQPNSAALMLGAGMAQSQTSQQPGSHHSTSSLVGGHQMSHSYGASAPQQQSYLPNVASKQQTQQQHGSSPQYRAPFPQLSPQMSPRPPQMSPHTQMSPRPVMSPAKPPVASQAPQTTLSTTSMSSHPHLTGSGGGNIQSPRPQQQTMPVTKLSTAASGPSGPVNTLQALEQMVMPPSAAAAGMEYSQAAAYRGPPHQQQMQNNPLSPLGPRLPMSPQHHQQWPPMVQRPGSGGINGNAHHAMQQQQQQQQPPQQQQHGNQHLPPMHSHAPHLHVSQASHPPPPHAQQISQLNDISSLIPPSQTMPVIPPTQQQQQGPPSGLQYSNLDDKSMVEAVQQTPQQQQHSLHQPHLSQSQQQQQQPTTQQLPSMHTPHQLVPQPVQPQQQSQQPMLTQLQPPTHLQQMQSQQQQHQSQHLPSMQTLQQQQQQQQQPSQIASVPSAHSIAQQLQSPSFNDEMLMSPSGQSQHQQQQQHHPSATSVPSPIAPPSVVAQQQQQQQSQIPISQAAPQLNDLQSMQTVTPPAPLPQQQKQQSQAMPSALELPPISTLTAEPVAVPSAESLAPQASAEQQPSTDLSLIDSLASSNANEAPSSLGAAGSIPESAVSESDSMQQRHSASEQNSSNEESRDSIVPAPAESNTDESKSSSSLMSGTDFEALNQAANNGGTAGSLLSTDVGGLDETIREGQTLGLDSVAADANDKRDDIYHSDNSNQAPSIADAKKTESESVTAVPDPVTSVALTEVQAPEVTTATTTTASPEQIHSIPTSTTTPTLSTPTLPSYPAEQMPGEPIISTSTPATTIPTNTTQMPPQQHPQMHPQMHPQYGPMGTPGMGPAPGQPPMYGMHMPPGGPMMHGMMGPDMMSPYPPAYQTHAQERAAIQQQLQDIYKLPMADNQEKIMRMQERISMLQQHETTDGCLGGPQCMMQAHSMYSSAMIDSPQVTSTTGRRGRTPSNKPRKPRLKKAEKLAQEAAAAAAAASVNPQITSGDETSQTPTAITALPVSEDAVTAGTGLAEVTSESFNEEHNETESQDNLSIGDLDTSTDASGKKLKKPRKPREPKKPKEAKEPKEPKEKKEPKKKEPKDGDKNKNKKRGRKSQPSEGDNSMDNSLDHDQDHDQDLSKATSEADENQTLASLMHSQNSTDATSGPEKDSKPEASGSLDDTEVTDFDDIPVSKIPIKSLLEESEKKEHENEDSAGDGADTEGETPKKKKSSKKKDPGSGEGGKKKSSSSSRNRNRSSGGGGGSKSSSSRSKRTRMTIESDGEGEDMASTPPPSPPPDPEIDSSKRRSARNTQRKKYVDDVMLRFSDDESAILSPAPSSSRRERKADQEKKEAVESSAGEVGGEVGADGAAASTSGTSGGVEGEEKVSTSEVKTELPAGSGDQKTDEVNKPNYVYVNTGDEDSMVVHYVLAVRMGKRELKPDPPPPPPKEKTPEPAEVKPEPAEGSEEKKPSEEATGADSEEAAAKTKVEGAEVKTEPVGADSKTVGADEESEGKKNDDKEVKKEEDAVKAEDSEVKMETDEAEAAPAATVDKVDEKPDEEKQKDDKEKESDKAQSKEPASEKMDTDEAEEKKEVDAEKASEGEKPKEEAVKVEAEFKKEDSAEEATEAEKKTEDVKMETDAVKEEKDKKVEEKPEEKKEPPVYIDVEEYYVKYRNFSYLHCEWRTEDELFKGDKRVGNKIKRFLQKQQQQLNIFESLDEEPFNPDFVEVDRVLDVSEHTDDDGKTVKHYLVKWKSLPYEDSTWELEDDVDLPKIEQYYRFNKIPPRSEWKTKKRPHPDQWKALPQSPIYKAGNSLRPYQLEGLNWLRYSWYKGNNCILADEMGLGKTIQSLTFVHSVYEYGIRGPFLVIAPLSTIPNWQREFEGWTDMNVIVYHGSANSRQMIQDYEVYYRYENGKYIKDINKFNVLITTFEMIVTDYQDLKPYNWRACVIDEAHRLKNRNCKLLEGLRQLNLEHRVLLSGTPLQNNVNELFSLLNFLEPSQFSCNEEFLREFGSLKTESEVLKLQALLKPMMLRRLKDDVEKSLAPKEETIVEVELTNIQKKYYRGILEQNFSFLMKGTTSANIPNLMNTMMELRKCCIHPYLLNGAEDQIQYDYRMQHGEDAEAYYKNLVVSSGKMVLIDKLLPKLKANGHRVLIFSQMVRCLDILEDYLIYRKYPFERIDGRIRGNLRQAAIDRYSKPDSDRFVFLLCTKAGGLGINLTAADTVIIYDSDWNPQNDLQAQARCHRIGQQKMVKIYRLLCRNTYEREMFDKASMKLGLDKAILQSMNTSQNKDGSQKQLSKKEIEDLLKKGAYGAVMDDDAGDKFCEEDIDSILLRRTQVITMESEKGSTFSKASFAAAANRSDINIDDPDFWNKWAKRAEIDPAACEKDETEDLVIAEPRKRTQIKRYGHDDGVMDMSEDSSGEHGSGDEDGSGLRTRSKRNRSAKDKHRKVVNEKDDYIPRDRDTLAALGFEDVSYGNWARSECFKVEKGLLSHGWARWTEILELGQFKRGWREQDVEDCARVILLYCLDRYQGDEKIKNFIWDLIAPSEGGEQREIARNHSGLHNLVPRGRNAKGRKSTNPSSASATPRHDGSVAEVIEDASSNSSGTHKEPTASTSQLQTPSKPKSGSDSGGTTTPVGDPRHWSKDEKYDADALLDINYKKHLTRHANKVLLRVRMLYYIRHEVLGDLVTQINEGANASDLPIRPPPTPDQLPCSWWNPNCCDRSLLVGTYRLGCENYREMRADPKLCFQSHCGPGDGTVEEASIVVKEADDDANSKQGDNEDDPEDGPSEARSSSAGVESKDDDEESTAGTATSAAPTPAPSDGGPNPELIWPSMQDLNTRLRRVITSYQRNYKKEELKQQQKAKLQAIVPPVSSLTGQSSSTPSTPSTTPGPIMGGNLTPQHQQQQQQQQSQQAAGSSGGGAGSYAGTSGLSKSQQQQVSAGGGGLSLSGVAPTGGMPTAADFSLMLSLGLGLNPADASQLANLDLQKLAMYLKMERREKTEQVMRERERVRLEQIPKKWTRREENEFIRVLTGYGIDLLPNTSQPTPDWSRFKAFAKLDKKSDENLSDFYKVFIAMCKRQAGVKLSEDEKGLDGLVDDVTEDHAKLILDRLELLSKAREIIKHPKLEENIRLCENNLDTPDWWISGKHDRELLRAVLKYGIYRSEQLILADPEFPFYEAAKKYLQNLEMQIQLQNQQLMKMQAAKAEAAEKAEAAAKAEKESAEKAAASAASKDDAVVEEEKPAKEVEKEPVEKPEAADAAEKVGEEDKKEDEVAVKSDEPEKEKVEEVKEPEDEKEEEKEADKETTKEETSEEKKDSEDDAAEKPAESAEKPEAMEVDEKVPSEENVEKKDEAKSDAEEVKEKPTEKDSSSEETPMETTTEVAEKPAEKSTDAEESSPSKKSEPEVPEKKPEPERESSPDVIILDEPKATASEAKPKLLTDEEMCSKQAAELKARFPDLEVFQPLMKLKQLDNSVSKEDIKQMTKFASMIDTSMIVKWFRDFALERRVGHVIYCVEHGEWPVGKSYSAYTGCLGIDLDIPLHETIKRIIPVDGAGSDSRRSASSTPDVITITTDHAGAKQISQAALSAQTAAAAAAALSAVGLGGSGSGSGSLQGLSQSQMAAAASAAAAAAAGVSLSSMPNQKQSQLQSSLSWNDDDIVDARRSGGNSSSSGSGLQPPPAHQHGSARNQMSSYAASKPQLIPGTSSTLTPIDLSSGYGLPKVNMADMLKSPMDLSEVQDFSIGKKQRGDGSRSGLSNTSISLSSAHGGSSSMPSPSAAVAAAAAAGKGKLNDMLSKLMKKNNVSVPIEEPPLGKEKKRRKLDEIVLGLSAAKEQKTIFGDPTPPGGSFSGSSMKKPQIPPSVSVTPASAPTSASQQPPQKPFTITVTSVPGTSKGGQGSSSSSNSNSGLAALQNMSGGMGALSTKDSLNALFAQAAQAEQQAFLKQQQKLIQSLPANSPQRKAYEVMFAEMKQAADLSSKLGQYGSAAHDAKVNKWLAEQTAALTEHAMGMDYLSRSSRRSSSSASQSQATTPTSSRSTRNTNASIQQQHHHAQQQQQQQQQQHQQQQQQQQQQQSDAGNPMAFNWKNLTGEEYVSVINKINGKRLTGNKAPQLKRLTQWLEDNPAYEIDPKWAESITLPPTGPISHPKQSSSDSASPSAKQMRSSSSASSMAQAQAAASSNQYGSSSGNQQSSSSSSTPSKKHGSSASSSSNAAAAANMQFAGLAGLNANLLSSIPGLGNFDPKSNPFGNLMPFGGMPGLAGLAGLGNLNNMNLFASLAGLPGLSGMDAQSLATMMAAAGLDPATALAAATGGTPTKSGGSSRSKSNKSSNDQSSSSSQQSSSKAAAAAAAAAANSQFPFFFPNPSLLYTPLGLGGLNPYGMPLGTSGVTTSTSSSTTTSRQSQSKQSNSSRGMSGGGSQQSASSPSSKSSRSSSLTSQQAAAAQQAALEAAQLQQLLLPHDKHLLDSLTRSAGLDITQSSRGGGSSSSASDKRARESAAAQQANKQALEKLERERRKILETLSQGAFPSDLAAMQAFATGKMPGSSSSSSGHGSSSKSSSSSSAAAAAAAAAAAMSAKDLQLPLPPEFSQALFAEMAAQALSASGVSGSGSSSKSSSSKSRDQGLKEAFEQLSKNPIELLARSLGVGPAISLIPTSSSSTSTSTSDSKRSSSSSSRQHDLQQQQAAQLQHHLSKLDPKTIMMGAAASQEEMKSPRTRSSTDSIPSLDKVTLTPVAAASIAASLPSQTTISLASPVGMPSGGGSGGAGSLNLSAKSPAALSTSSASSEREHRDRERERSERTERHERAERSERSLRSTDMAADLSRGSSSSSGAGATVTAVPIPATPQNLSATTPSASSAGPAASVTVVDAAHNAEMDLEDLIAPSKLSKSGNVLNDEDDPQKQIMILKQKQKLLQQEQMKKLQEAQDAQRHIEQQRIAEQKKLAEEQQLQQQQQQQLEHEQEQAHARELRHKRRREREESERELKRQELERAAALSEDVAAQHLQLDHHPAEEAPRLEESAPAHEMDTHDQQELPSDLRQQDELDRHERRSSSRRRSLHSSEPPSQPDEIGSGGNKSDLEKTPEMHHPPSRKSTRSSTDAANSSGGESSSAQPTTPSGPGGRRATRSKRRRSGDESEAALGVPERKRELRSSAGRQAAAAAARMAAEAKAARAAAAAAAAAQSAEGGSLNLSKDQPQDHSDKEDQQPI
ncbi:uncharacterized protein LOC120426896 isoform X3 [Culex pipiens pallens]|uniref:uncharacterized protein LOC120426896 isoform X3 n=1 Tax=Culex pipiens pallens TaxID=42434 RepID=UPI001954A930|nr:uncharacterized protein LOC120426896 isoform X3 [Culex pipiens pallens]